MIDKDSLIHLNNKIKETKKIEKDLEAPKNIYFKRLTFFSFIHFFIILSFAIYFFTSFDFSLFNMGGNDKENFYNISKNGFFHFISFYSLFFIHTIEFIKAFKKKNIFSTFIDLIGLKDNISLYFFGSIFVYVFFFLMAFFIFNLICIIMALIFYAFESIDITFLQLLFSKAIIIILVSGSLFSFVFSFKKYLKSKDEAKKEEFKKESIKIKKMKNINIDINSIEDFIYFEHLFTYYKLNELSDIFKKHESIFLKKYKVQNMISLKEKYFKEISLKNFNEIEHKTIKND